MEDAYLYPRDSMSSETTMRMSVNSLDCPENVGGRGQIHANLAFVSTPEHGIISPLSLVKDPRPSYVKSPPPPPPPKNKGTVLSSVTPSGCHQSTASCHVESRQSRPSGVDDLPIAPQQPRSFSVFQQSLSTNAGEVRSTVSSDLKSSAATPKGTAGPELTMSGVQLRSKPSMRKEDRERSHLYEELPWAEQEGVAAAAAMAAIVPVADNSSGAKERRRANPLYSERSSIDVLPSKPDSSLANVQLETSSAMTHRLQQHCCVFSSLIGALAVIAIAALVIAILAMTGMFRGGTQTIDAYSTNTTELLLRLVDLQAKVSALKATVDQQELKISDYAIKLNVTSAAFSKCTLSRSRAIKQQITDSVSDEASQVIVGAFCNGGSLVTSISSNSNNATINIYQCLCSNSSAGCELLYWACPAQLF